MSIRPIDYTTVISKIQDVSKIKQGENKESNVQVEMNIHEQEKQINQELSRVRNINEAENIAIDANKEKEKKKDSRRKGKRRVSKGSKDKDTNKDKDKIKDGLGENIDIRI